MASGDERSHSPENLSGVGLRIGVVAARWNSDVVGRLRAGVSDALKQLAVTQIREVSVPGSFEIPMACKALAESGTVDAIVCLGVVIRGETTHYELVAGECASGVQRVQLDTGIPIGFGVLTVENVNQALERSQPDGRHNVGAEAAAAAVEMARLVQSLPSRH